MKDNKSSIWTLLVLLVVVGIIAVGAVITAANRVSTTELTNEVNKAKLEKTTEMNAKIAAITKDMDILKTQIAKLNTDIATATADKTKLTADIARLTKENTDLKLELDDNNVAADYYLVTGVNLDSNFKTSIDSGDLESLTSDKFTYDGDKYTTDEVIYLSEDFKPVLNDDDSNGAVQLGILDENGIKYVMEFNSKLELTGDDDLTIDFMGSPITLVDYESGELTYRTSELKSGKIGDSFKYEDSTIKIIDIDTDNEKVLFDVNELEKSVAAGASKTIDGVEIALEDVFANKITFYVGKDITQTVETGDEYEPNDDWSWEIVGDSKAIKSIGLVLTRTYADSDELLDVGDSIYLPGKYKEFTFDKVKNLEVSDISLKVSNTKLKVTSADEIEIDGNRIDDATFTVALDGLTVTYENGGDEETTTDFGDIKFLVDDREISFSMSGSAVNLGNYVFAYANGKFTGSSGLADEMNEDNNYRMDNGDLLYKSTVNEDKGTDTVKIGFVGDKEPEAILKVQ